MNLKDLLKYKRGPLPLIGDIDRLILQLQRLKEYYKEDANIIKYNTVMYQQIKNTMISGAKEPKLMTTISDSLWDIVENGHKEDI